MSNTNKRIITKEEEQFYGNFYNILIKLRNKYNIDTFPFDYILLNGVHIIEIKFTQDKICSFKTTKGHSLPFTYFTLNDKVSENFIHFLKECLKLVN